MIVLVDLGMDIHLRSTYMEETDKQSYWKEIIYVTDISIEFENTDKAIANLFHYSTVTAQLNFPIDTSYYDSTFLSNKKIVYSLN